MQFLRFLRELILELGQLILRRLLLTRDTTRPPMPGFTLVAIRESTDMADKWLYTFQLDAPGATDVVEREANLTTPRGTGTTKLDPSARELTVIVEENEQCTITLIDVDNARNRSQPAVMQFVAVDAIAPPAPGIRMTQAAIEVNQDTEAQLQVRPAPGTPDSPLPPANPEPDPETPPAEPEAPVDPEANNDTTPVNPTTPVSDPINAPVTPPAEEEVPAVPAVPATPVEGADFTPAPPGGAVDNPLPSDGESSTIVEE